MELFFLGTGAGMPSRRRNVTSIVLNLAEETGSVWLFDCGEGTQHQILKSPIRPGRINKIFITHLHGDHIFGLPGLLSSRSYQGGETAVELYGPPGVKEFIDKALRLSQTRLGYELRITEITDQGIILEEDSFRVEAGRLEHRIECFGYRIIEKDKQGKLDASKLKRLGIAPGPVYGLLKRGESVRMENGTCVRSEDVVGPSIPGRVIAIMGDTIRSAKAIALAHEADVLVHEATFDQTKQDLAARFLHATTIDAAEVAKQARAKVLIMTHISARYDESATEQRLLQEAKRIFPEAYVAEDFWCYRVQAPQIDPGEGCNGQ